MRILYGVAGVGFGHSSRALLVADYLEREGHEVKIVTYGDGYEVLRKRFDCMKVDGLTLIFKKGMLKKRRTLETNVKKFPKNFLKWKKFYRMMKDFKPDLCISDMEPLVPILSSWYRLPLVSLDNQHRLTNFRIDVPKGYRKDFLIAKNTVRSFVGRADKFIVSSFGGGSVVKKNTVVVPPIVREEVRALKPKCGDKVLVYLSKSDKKCLRVLRGIDERFVVYGFDVKRKSGNVEFRKRGTFLRYLENCKCVIGTAGFSLMGEAIYLKKPYLAIPLKGQFEQVLNALFLERAGFGKHVEVLGEEDVRDFLGNLSKYRKKLRGYTFDGGKLFREIDKVLKEFG